MRWIALAILAFAALPAHSATFALARSGVVYCASAQSCSAVADCPEGLVVLGGGGTGDQVKLVESSYPAGSTGWLIGFRPAYREYASGANGNAEAFAICGAPPPWQVSWYPDYEDFASSAIGGAIPYAICADAAPEGFNEVFSSPASCHQDGPSCIATAWCANPGQVMIGGGFIGGESKVESMGFSDILTWLVSWYPASAEYASSAFGSGVAVAFCADGAYVQDSIFQGSFDL